MKTARSTLATTAFLLCAAPEGPAVAQVQPPEPAPEKVEAAENSLRGKRYVAMGSSFAAGPMLPPGKPGAPARCGRSMNNYPTLLAERFGMVLVDRTCSGAKTQHILGPWGDIPPQIEAVNEATRLVTVTIGGNDINYIGNLFTATCLKHAREASAAGRKPPPCGGIFRPSDADYVRLEAQMNEIARRARAAAPRARLVFVQYLTPLPQKLCEVTPISEADAALVRTIGRRLAEITGRVALAHKAIVVEMNQSSATHTPCDAEPWMNGSPKNYDGKQGMRWHLNLEGMKATADGIAYWLSESGVQPDAPQMTSPPARPAASAPAPVGGAEAATAAPAQTSL